MFCCTALYSIAKGSPHFWPIKLSNFKKQQFYLDEGNVAFV